ncbi:hypothetical protein YC2023_006825 [Brassica napus]
MRQARTQEMKEKEMKSQANGDANSHICKYVNHVPSLALNAQFAGQRSLIAYLRFRLNQRQIKGTLFASERKILDEFGTYIRLLRLQKL